MHVETYPAFFSPRDEEPSLSSSEEKSSEFDWLEIKRTRKQIYEEETEQVFYSLISHILYIYGIDEQGTCSVFPSYFCFLVSFLSSQSNSEDFSLLI